ncbi:MAG: nucleotidyltransferase domain-containing protein [Candidatus Woesearchaeota archaeon]|nr:nucleotidyltransferase domain-containing protein [Candidatus Woesearchaeota archaeon]
MIFTKTEIKVLELFVSRILDSFMIREVSRLIKKDLKIVHTSMKKLKAEEFFIEEKGGLRLNYRKNIGDLAYIENIRKEDFFKKHDLIKIHIKTFLKKCSGKFFVLLVFGTYAAGKETKKSDIDLLAILPSENEKFERELKSGLSVLNKKFHISIIGEESFKEMLSKRDEMNVVNETFNNHVMLYGAEQYYALLGERDVR